MLYFCRNLTDICLLKQGEGAIPPSFHGQGESLKTKPNQTPPHPRIDVSKSESGRGLVALRVPESNRRLSAETRGKPLSPPPTRPGRILEKNTQSNAPQPKISFTSRRWRQAEARWRYACSAIERAPVYSSTRFSSLIFEDEMICMPRTARYVMGIKE